VNLEDIVQKTKTYYCLECGKCTSICPVSRYDSGFSPRMMIEHALLGFEDDLVHNNKLFSCLTCYTCQPECPSDVDFPIFVREARAWHRIAGNTVSVPIPDRCSHWPGS
jgi:heterodisulfide reductase subunit D